MLVHKAVKVQIYPGESSKELLAKHFDACRFINKFLEIKRKKYTENKKSLGYNECTTFLKKMKKDPSFAWLKEVNVAKNILRYGLNILSSGQATGSDVKQKPKKAPGLLWSMSPEDIRVSVHY